MYYQRDYQRDTDGNDDTDGDEMRGYETADGGEFEDGEVTFQTKGRDEERVHFALTDADLNESYRPTSRQ